MNQKDTEHIDKIITEVEIRFPEMGMKKGK